MPGFTEPVPTTQVGPRSQARQPSPGPAANPLLGFLGLAPTSQVGPGTWARQLVPQRTSEPWGSRTQHPPHSQDENSSPDDPRAHGNGCPQASQIWHPPCRWAQMPGPGNLGPGEPLPLKLMDTAPTVQAGSRTWARDRTGLVGFPTSRAHGASQHTPRRWTEVSWPTSQRHRTPPPPSAHGHSTHSP